MDLKQSLKETLSLVYINQLEQVEQDLGLSTSEVIVYLIDFYSIETPLHLHQFRLNLLARIKRGIDSAFIVQLKLIYILLGHFLQRIRAL